MTQFETRGFWFLCGVLLMLWLLPPSERRREATSMETSQNTQDDLHRSADVVGLKMQEISQEGIEKQKVANAERRLAVGGTP